MSVHPCNDSEVARHSPVLQVPTAISRGWTPSLENASRAAQADFFLVSFRSRKKTLNLDSGQPTSLTLRTHPHPREKHSHHQAVSCPRAHPLHLQESLDCTTDTSASRAPAGAISGDCVMRLT